MSEQKNGRAGLIVWLYTTKYVNKLKRYGLVHYVSKNINYAVLYVNKDEREDLSRTISKQHFVRKVENAYQCELPKTFDGVLDKVTEMAKKKTELEKSELETSRRVI
ncbi:YlbG family protein [Alkalibacterium sp. s-m-22]|uniref:Uncharacterized protein YlbG, UPF0298 family n=1 Tax=Alkalibacterium thalassium TaxID=426701 RepID=A0A1G8WWI5_9LACT|nr:YlbG family protein [Alkalibacterium thalassium]SDJ81920.1 Uncharacterized protein YlbG, UPF0298 family [Alkalibacterium thalassium]